MRFAIILYFLATLLSTSQSNILNDASNPIRLLQPHSGVGRLCEESSNCLSWRLAVETNNRRGWEFLPDTCVDYVRCYMAGREEENKHECKEVANNQQYDHDCKEVSDDAIEYAQSFEGVVKEKDIWVFDIEETTLSNLEYFARDDVQFGGTKYDSAKFDKWLLEAKAEAVPGMLDLYKRLRDLGFKIVFLTGKREGVRKAREENLRRVGYDQWEKVIFKEENALPMKSIEFKSEKREELVKDGYNIVGNVGDQWSDITGNYTGIRTFKVPNPMYYTY